MAQTKKKIKNTSKKVLPVTNQTTTAKSTDNYNTSSKKVWHFVLGLSINVLIAVLAFVLLYAINGILYQDASFIAKIIDAILLIGIIIGEIKVIKFLFKTDKRYIGIGMICSAILPLLTAGFCSAIMYSNF